MEGRQEKKKMGIKIVAGAGGGLAGIILLGGALATAALVSTFVIKRKQHSNSNSTHNQKTNQIDLLNKSNLKDDHELGSEGLSFLVSDSSSPLNHHPSNGTAVAQNELGSTQILILDETSKIEINGGKDREILLSDFPEKTGNNAFCDESCISKEEFSFPAFDSSSGKLNKKNEPLEEVEERKVDEMVKVAHSNRVVVDDNCEIPSNIEEKDEACDGNWEIIVGKIEELVEAAQANQLGVDESLHKPGEECDEDGEMTTVEKREELVEAIHAENGIQLSQEQETTMVGDEEIICFDSSITDRNEDETYDVNRAEILLSVIDSSSLSKPGNDDSAEVPLIIETMQLMKRDETIEAVQGDQITVEDRPQAQLIEPEEKEEESYEVDREITNGKCEEADQIAVEDHQQMQLSEYQESPINGDQEKFISDKLSPESNSLLVYGVKVQEFSLPPPDGPLLSESGNLNEDNSAEAALHIEVVKPMEENETAEEVIYDQIIVENNPPTQFSEKRQIENCNDCSENVVAKGEEAVETVHEDIVEVFNNQKKEVSEEEDEDDDDNHIDSKNVEEAVETVHVHIVEVDKNPQTQLSEAVEEDGDDNNGGSENGKETVEMVHTDILEVEKTLQTSSSQEDDEEESDDEEDDVGKVEEESSETTGDSSLESNAEAIWPAESVQELSLKLKELQANEQNLEETNEEDMKVNTENGYVRSNGHNIKEEGEGEEKGKFVRASTQKFMTETAALKQPINLFNLKFWIWSLLVPLLLLVWLHFA